MTTALAPLRSAGADVAPAAAAPCGAGATNPKQKHSGYGREMGSHALELYTQTKNVIVNLG